jgi:hypothetical protein
MTTEIIRFPAPGASARPLKEAKAEYATLP